MKRAGHTVRILEQCHGERKSQGTGLGLGPSAREFLELYDGQNTTLSHSTTSLSILNNKNEVRSLVTGRRDLTSWDAVYYRLRLLFDGFTSQYSPGTLKETSANEFVTYESQKRVTAIRRPDGPGAPITLTIHDMESQEVELVDTEFVLGADGSNSVVRTLYMPRLQRHYAGYVMWRGLVPENEASIDTRRLVESSVIAHKTSERSSCIMYMIPGINGSLKLGERFINFIWYTNETTQEVAEIMRDDINGRSHHGFVPKGYVRHDIWFSRLEKAKHLPLPESFLEVATKIREPSVQMITDYCSSRAAFENGRVLLVGDAISQFRPHAALGVSQAAFHALAVKDYLSGRISWQQWERKVLRYSHLHWCMNIWWGDFFQKNLIVALLSAFRYWGWNFTYKLLAWWN